jgi:hypothetical protein
MGHYQAYKIDYSLINAIIESLKYGAWNVKWYNQTLTPHSGYKIFDELNSKIIGLKVRYGNNG